jgi:hypothetical protein
VIEWYVGFYNRAFRNHLGAVQPTSWFGHAELWGYTADDTWLFLDPKASGTLIVVIHRHDDVLDQLRARFALCDLILRLPAKPARLLFPIHMPMTCATIIGHILGVRAFTPSGLRRKLLANGAEIVSEKSQGRPGRQGREGTPAQTGRT